jgi:hypothetical protein
MELGSHAWEHTHQHGVCVEGSVSCFCSRLFDPEPVPLPRCVLVSNSVKYGEDQDLPLSC